MGDRTLELGTRRPRSQTKRDAMISAGRAVFGRHGYAGASVDVIAAEAGVSKRTIYNHFGDKERLFVAVAIDGAQQVTETVRVLMERHLRKIVDVEQDLIDFARDRAESVFAFPDHFALVRVIEAEAPRLSAQARDAWTADGPHSAYERLAPYIERIAAGGALVVPDPVRAARHFNLLTITDVNQRSFYGAVPLPDGELEELVTDGVRTFLTLYRAG